MDTLTVADLNISASNTTSSIAQTTSAMTSLAAEVVTTTASSSSSIVPVAAVGIAVPLSVLLLAALIACGFLLNQVRKLRKEKAEWSKQAEAAVVPAETHYGRQSSISAAPAYEYKQVTNTNWQPYTPQSARAQEYNPHATAAVQHQPSYQSPQRQAVEMGDGHLGELPAEDVPKP